MNRIITQLNQRHDPCPCCAARREYQRIKEIVEKIEADAGDGIFEFIIPSVNKLAGHNEDLDGLDYIDADDTGDEWKEGELSVRFYLSVESRQASLDEDLRRYTVEELRRMAAELRIAADAVEAGGGGTAVAVSEGGVS